MRPRSRPPSKRRLVLPTITEGTEETLRDLNEANMLHITGHSQPVSSEDYLLSICHLAHPTFPTRDVSPDGILTRHPEAAHQRPRPSRLQFHPTEAARASEVQEGGPATKQDVGLILGSSDPLEYLYGHRGDLPGAAGRSLVERRSAWDGQARSRAHSIPCPSSPKLCQRKSSCHDIRAGAASPAGGSEGGRGGPAGRGAEPKRQNAQCESLKPSLISQWISECRSAWREARVRACMLPAIAEI